MKPTRTDKFKKVGEFGVDSGLVWIGDPCYLKSGQLPWEDWLKFCGGISEAPEEMEMGVLSNTGWGDGSYPVYARMEGNRVMELRIVFDEEGEED